MAKKQETISLGAGQIYCMDIPLEDNAVPKKETLFTTPNLLAETSGGCHIIYTPTWIKAASDYDMDHKTALSGEAGQMKFGACHFIDKALAKLIATAKTSTEESEGDILDIGGIKNDNGKDYYFGFLQQDGNLAIIVKGKNVAPFDWAFTKDKEVVYDAEIECTKLPNGALIRKLTTKVE